MQRLMVSLICVTSLLAAHAGSVTLESPNGAVRIVLTTDGEGHLVYSVAAGERARMLPARAGVIVDGADLGAAVELGAPRTRSVAEVFPWRGGKGVATNLCRVSEIGVRAGAAGQEWTLEARVFNDGAAFRYRVPGDGTRRVGGESTCWQLPPDALLWFQTDTDDYEGVYQSRRADQVPLEEEVDGKRRPLHIGPPMTAAFADGGFALVTEASLYRYSGLTLRPAGGARFGAAFEDDPAGWSHDGALLSPWRVIVLAADLNGLVNSDVIPALGDPPDPELFPDGMNTAWIRPGKAPCTWMVFGNDGAQWDRQKWFVDRCAAMNCEYLLVDAGWRTERWGWLKDGGDLWARAAELCRYASERDVGIVLWHSFPEGRDDGPGLSTIAAREELFSNCQKAGVKGVKIDFFNSESRAVIDAYEDLLQRSARHRLMVNFHGVNKPAGEPRTWPHEITREGIREQEYVLWSELPLEHYGALPFTRMAAGHADFLPGYVQPQFLKNTTAIFQMAAVIVFSSPFLCWADSPEAYVQSPLLHFVRTVPVTWDETRVLPGSAIGETVVMARRKGAEWYVALLNCRGEARELELDLAPFGLDDKQMTLYRDGPEKGACAIEAGLRPPAAGKLPVALAPGGGAVVWLGPPKAFEGWR